MTEKAVKAIEEDLSIVEEGQELIELADRSDTSWVMVAKFHEDELAEDSDDKIRTEKAVLAPEYRAKMGRSELILI